jgi:hypothetical protein
MMDKLDDDLLDKMKFAERMAYQKKILEDLMARYPREFKPYQSYANLLKTADAEDYTALRNRWVHGSKDHPDDPLALLLAANALTGKDTPQAIALLQSARTKASDFPWPALQLASIYSTGKRADPARTKESLEAFFTLCPGSADGAAGQARDRDRSQAA